MKEHIERLERAIVYMADNLVTFGSGKVDKQVHEILNPPSPNDFLECDTCRAKAGSPVLCRGCLHNRDLVERLKSKKNS